MATVYIREKPLKGGKVSLRLDYFQNGERHIETLNIHVFPADKKSRDLLKRRAYEEKYQHAEYLRLQKEQALVYAEHELPTRFNKKASFIEYFDKLAATRPATWQSTRKHLVDFAGTVIPFGNITEEWLNRFQEYLQARIKNVTVCTYIGIVTTCLNNAVRDKLIGKNPSANIKKVRGKEELPKYLTEEKLQTIIEASDGIPTWLVDAFVFCCNTGLRLSDAETLTWSEIESKVDSNRNTSYTICKKQIKTGEVVTIPLSKTASKIMLRQPSFTGSKGDSKVFYFNSRTSIKRYINKWRKQAGIHFSYHHARHTFGTRLQSAGVDINTTSKLMGHKSINMTLRYAKVVDKAKDEAIARLDDYLK